MQPDGRSTIDDTSPASAAVAWALGLSMRKDALAWLMRAARLAPKDPRIAFDLARARLNGDPEGQKLAEISFAALTRRYDAPGAWIGLMMARRLLGDISGAAEALKMFLSHHCIPADTSFLLSATAIAQQAGYQDFCGYYASMRLHPRSATGRLLVPEFDIAALTRIDGIVQIVKQGLAGWAARRAADGAPPKLILRDAEGQTRTVRCGELLPPDDSAPFLSRYGFKVSRRVLDRLKPPFILTGPDNAQISGSPISPEIFSQEPIPAALRGKKITPTPRLRQLAIVVPVYRGMEETKACITALIAARPKRAKLIVIDDASPDRALTNWLDKLSSSRKIILYRHSRNSGFPTAANSGFALSGDRDVLLVNSDTIVPPGAIQTLRNVAYADHQTGSVTPLSNEGTIVSYPSRRGGNLAPDATHTAALQRLVHYVNACTSHEIPTAIGFCMYIRHDCLKAVGGFRPELFAHGYGEENDWSIRARHRGFVHRVACGAFVTHIGGISFGAASRELLNRNLEILERIYPGYHSLIVDHLASDPLRIARRRIDIARLKTSSTLPSVLLISHSHGGGVARQVAVQLEELRQQNRRPLLLNTQFPDAPNSTPFPWPSQLSEGDVNEYPNLAFMLPKDWATLVALLRALRVEKIILHHALGHHPKIHGLAAALGLPQDIVVHDYACFCPRVNLLNRVTEHAPPRYCGEPAPAGCVQCCEKNRDEIYEPLPISDLLSRSKQEFEAAKQIIVPSNDTARRIIKHFPSIRPKITPWEDDRRPASLTPPARRGQRTIAVIGGIGPSKGYDILLACAEDAGARNLDLQFIVAGISADDEQLIATGKIFVTGPYTEGEATSLIASFQPDLAFLPSIWPETWCFALSEAWLAGLYAITFDLGAQAERIKSTGRGLTLPLGLPIHRINDILLSWQPP